MRIASYVMFTMDIDEARIVLRAIGKEKHLKVKPRLSGLM